MKKFYSILVTFIISVMLILGISNVYSQCEPFIKIDGEIVIANETVPSGLALPIWLKEGQTLAVGLTVRSISVIEFSENNNALEYSQVLSINSSAPVGVPAGKVWKVESIVKEPNIGEGVNKLEYVMSGNNSFTVPSCAEYICIEVWGAGGGGQGGKNNSPGPVYSGAGGGGGSYGKECFSVTPGTTYTVNVGAGGAGGAGGPSPSNGSVGGKTEVVTLISANGGNGGITGGGTGGTSSAEVSVTGFKGLGGTSAVSALGGSGGYGGNGGAGGTGVSAANGNPGNSPGGGGAGGGISSTGNTGYTGGAGADGKVIIYW